jgi:hypothetical protein
MRTGIRSWGRRSLLGSASAVVVLGVVACGSQANPTSRPSAGTSTAGIPGCAPACLDGFSDPGLIGPGEYKTQHFFNGQLTVTFTGKWLSNEDQGVEFSAAPVGRSEGVKFWSDLLPIAAGKQVPNVPNTAAGLERWLRSRRNISVSKSRPATVGSDRLPAIVLDIGIAKGAVNESSDCSEVCVDLFTWPNAGQSMYGFGGSAVLRLYPSDIAYGGSRHLFAIGIEGRDPVDLEDFHPVAEKLIASVRAPVSGRR